MKYKQNITNRYHIIPKITSILNETILFVSFSLINIITIIWGLITSLKPSRLIHAYPPLFFGFTATLDHYRVVIKNGFTSALMYSLFICLVSIILGLFLALLAGYGFQRYKFPFKKILFILIASCIPLSIGSSALLIPNYLYLSSLDMVNKWYTLILLYTAYNLPMAIWIVKGGIEIIPIEIEEAALIDGCSRPYILFRIVTILCRPSLAAAALFFFIGSWNEFITAAVMISSPQYRTVQLLVYQFLGVFGQDWGPLTAASIMSIAPVLIVFTILGKMLISGLTQGSVKG